MKIKSLILIAFLAFAGIIKAQVYTGGNMGVNYNDGMVVDLAPLAGYKYKIFQAGVSPFFLYAEKTNSYAFGGRIFSEVTFFKETFLHAEFEVANNEVYENSVKTRKWVMAMPLGAGYRYKIAPGTYAYGMILYDVLQNENSTNKNPIIRGGITYQPGK